MFNAVPTAFLTVFLVFLLGVTFDKSAEKGNVRCHLLKRPVHVTVIKWTDQRTLPKAVECLLGFPAPLMIVLLWKTTLWKHVLTM